MVLLQAREDCSGGQRLEVRLQRWKTIAEVRGRLAEVNAAGFSGVVSRTSFSPLQSDLCPLTSLFSPRSDIRNPHLRVRVVPLRRDAFESKAEGLALAGCKR